MKTASYAHSLHNSTAFTQMKKGDGIASYAWKLPTGRVLSSAVTLIALAEALLFSLATVAFSPLYVLDNERFHVLADDAKDSTKTAAKAAGRIFGFGHIETEKLPTPPAPLPPAKPTSLKERALDFIKTKAADVYNTDLKHPSATLVVTAIAVTAATAYYLGLFDSAASLLSSPKAPTPDLKDMCRFSDFNPFPHEVCKLTDAPISNTSQAVTAVVDNGFCQAPLDIATNSSPLAFYPEASAAESRVALWTPAVKKAASSPALPSMNWEKLYTRAAPEIASTTPVAPLMIAPPAASPQPLFPLNTNWIHWAAQKLNGTK